MLLGLLAAAPLATAAPAAPADPKPQTPMERCSAEATKRQISQWLCIGGTLVYPSVQEKDGKKRKITKVKKIAPSTSGPRASRQETPSRAAQDDYDDWCEFGGVCRRNISDYVHETKGNAGYGDQDGAVGSFDVILRIRLNGSQPQFKATFIWDSGPTLHFTGTGIECREEQWGSDSSCGVWPVDGPEGNGAFNIGEDDYRDDGPLIYGNRLEDPNDYFAKVFGNFRPDGYPTYVMSELKSGTWDCFGLGSQCLFR